MMKDQIIEEQKGGGIRQKVTAPYQESQQKPTIEAYTLEKKHMVEVNKGAKIFRQRMLCKMTQNKGYGEETQTEL